ncbi:MAG: 3-phosphoshikimate 1-carboxyvinyltransferase [Dehalococcoidales bacterium]|nr:3-phosphoshikimate 1-carboxyvinyltransferase [Dehalococcoidales bacterium]
MKVSIKKSEIKGEAKVPSSKSMTIRALVCAALSRGKSEIVNPLVSDDTASAADVLGTLGVEIQKSDDTWVINGGKLRVPTEDLYCGESATTMRFITAVCSLIPGKHKITGGPSLSKRPMRSLIEALQKLGIKGSTEGKTTPPVTVEGGTLKGGVTELPGNISSQFISALLLVAPFAKQEVSIRMTTPLTSKPYVLMTLWCLRKFGINIKSEWDRFVIRRQAYKPTRMKIEGDWSSASYLLALGAVAGELKVDNLSTASLQGDRVMLDYLRSMGAMVRVAGNSVTVSNEGTLRAVHADLSDCIDLLPTMAVLAAFAEGTSVFIGIERARIKESNRVTAVREGLTKLGVTVTEDRDSLSIIGLKTPKPKTEQEEEEEEAKEGEEKAKEEAEEEGEPVTVDSYGDHRIAMAFGVVGAALGGVIIEGAECVGKTFPDFWEVIKGAGAKVEIDAK